MVERGDEEAGGHLQRAEALLAVKRPEDAVAAASLAVAAAPDDPRGWAVLSTARSQCKRHTDALLAAHEVIRLDPQGARGHLRSSNVLAALFRWAEAVGAAVAAVANEPLHAEAHARLALASADRALYTMPKPQFWTCQDLLTAKAHVAKALALDPWSVYIRCAGGRVAAVAGDPDLATTHYRAALGLDPTCGPALRYLAEGQGNNGGRGMSTKTSALHDVLRTDPTASWATSQMSTLSALATTFLHGLGWSLYLLAVALLAPTPSPGSGQASWASLTRPAAVSALVFLGLCYHAHPNRRLREVLRSLRRRYRILQVLRVTDLTMAACLTLGVLGVRGAGHPVYYYGALGIPAGMGLMLAGLISRHRRLRRPPQTQTANLAADGELVNPTSRR